MFFLKGNTWGPNGIDAWGQIVLQPGINMWAMGMILHDVESGSPGSLSRECGADRPTEVQVVRLLFGARGVPPKEVVRGCGWKIPACLAATREGDGPRGWFFGGLVLAPPE